MSVWLFCSQGVDLGKREQESVVSLRVLRRRRALSLSREVLQARCVCLSKVSSCQVRRGEHVRIISVVLKMSTL